MLMVQLTHDLMIRAPLIKARVYLLPFLGKSSASLSGSTLLWPDPFIKKKRKANTALAFAV